MFLYFPILFLLWTPTDNPLCVMNRCTKEKIISRWQLSLGATDTIIIFSFNNAHGEWIFLAKTLIMIRHWDENKHIFTYFFLHSNYQLIAWSHDKCHIHEVLFPNLKKMLLLPSAFCYFMNQNNKNTHVLDRTAKGQIWRPLRDQDNNGLGGRYSCACVKGQIHFWWRS